MTSSENDAAPEGAAPQPELSWLRASAEDIATVDFEAPISGATTADCAELSDLYRAAVRPQDNSAEPPDTPEVRVFIMLSAITDMYPKPQERNEPFGPMVTFADGRRSAIPSDFRAHIPLVGDMATRAANPVLRARLSDLCWLLDKKQGGLGLAAIAAYTEIVQKMDDGELKHRFASENGALQHGARDYLLRALQIGRAVGWEKPEMLTARDLVGQLRRKALQKGGLVPIYWFSDLDLDYRISDPAEIGASLRKALAAVPFGSDVHNVVNLWQLAATAYHLAKMEDEKHLCLSEAAEALVAEAEAKNGSAMLAAHFMSAAIAQLHGIPGKKDKRTAYATG
ncbi:MULTISPECIES: hypothetical protein [unclassified Mesorhizobium]|uniref:DUF7380 domain-containing protein n=1 Tax=unclassified Mesorhizobium TaxID=325217 RepID=UPI001FEF3197|nr:MULTISPECIES: hypothetical protein [unclassified Mesorhizobium]